MRCTFFKYYTTCEFWSQLLEVRVMLKSTQNNMVLTLEMIWLVNFTRILSIKILFKVCCFLLKFLHSLIFIFFVLQLATWDPVHGLNGSLKESRIENGMQGVTVKVVTLLVTLFLLNVYICVRLLMCYLFFFKEIKFLSLFTHPDVSKFNPCVQSTP